MTLGRVVRRGLQAVLLPTVFLSLVAYFLWNASQGERGLQAATVRQEQLRGAQAELARMTLEQSAWEHRVAGLQSQHLDPDTLDERARAMLNVADPGDIVVMYGPGKKLF